MSENEKFILSIPESVTYTADGRRIVEGVGYASPGLSEGETREMLANGYGFDPDSIEITGLQEATASRGRRLSVGFRRWNSSWDPDATRQNASLN